MERRNKKIRDILYLALILLLYSCSNKKDLIDIRYNEYKFEVYQDKDQVVNYFKSINQDLSFEDSYPKISDGVEMFYCYSDTDSIVSRIELYFYKSVLQGINLNLSSKSLTPERFFEKMDNKVFPKFENSIVDANKELVIIKNKFDKIDAGGIRHFFYSIDLETKELNKLNKE